MLTHIVRSFITSSHGTVQRGQAAIHIAASAGDTEYVMKMLVLGAQVGDCTVIPPATLL